jgi:hypothetical protein
MATLTLAAAARGCRVARSPLQRAINAGRLSLDAEHPIETADLLRAGSTLHAALQPHTHQTLHGALQDAAPRSSRTRQDAAGDVPGHAALRQQTITALERANALLRAALDAAAARAQEARATAHAARDARALLLQMLQDMPHRYDRLLDRPRSAAIPPQSPQDRLGATQAAPPAQKKTSRTTGHAW